MTYMNRLSIVISTLVIGVLLVSFACYGAEPTPSPVDLPGRMETILASQFKELGGQVPEGVRKRAQDTAQSLLKDVGKEQQALAVSPCADAYLTTLCLLSLTYSLNQDGDIKATEKTRLVDEVSRRKMDLFDKNKQAFAESGICVVLTLAVSHGVNLKDYPYAFRCGQQLSVLKYDPLQLHNKYNMLMDSLNLCPSNVTFGGAVWGLLPEDVADDVQIELQWSAVSDVSTYRQSRVLIDRRQRVFTIINMPPGEYRLVFSLPETGMNVWRPVSVGESCLFMKDLNLKNLRDSAHAPKDAVIKPPASGEPKPQGVQPADLGPANSEKSAVKPSAVHDKDGKTNRP